MRGQFTSKGTQESVFESLAGELKTKTENIDTIKFEIDGKSRTTALRFGTKFHARVTANSDPRVEIFDIAMVTSDAFIKQVYKTFTKYASASPLSVEFVKQIDPVPAELDRARPPVGGALKMAADVQGESKMLPATGKPCKKCGALNPDDNRFCKECGNRLAGCPECGHVPEEDASFCIKCGAKLA